MSDEKWKEDEKMKNKAMRHNGIVKDLCSRGVQLAGLTVSPICQLSVAAQAAAQLIPDSRMELVVGRCQLNPVQMQESVVVVR